MEYQRELTALKQKIADLSKEAEEVKIKHIKIRETLKVQKEELFEEKKEEFRKTLALEQKVEEVDAVDKQNWRRNTSSSSSDSSDAPESLAIEFNLPTR